MKTKDKMLYPISLKENCFKRSDKVYWQPWVNLITRVWATHHRKAEGIHFDFSPQLCPPLYVYYYLNLSFSPCFFLP